MTIRDEWAERFRRDEPGLRQLLEVDVFKDWERNAMPEASADGALAYACRILFAGADDTLAARFLDRCIQVCRRAAERPSAQLTGRARALRQARLSRAEGHARALLSGEVDRVLMFEAVDAFAQVYAGISWDDQTEAYFLARLRLSLILGEGGELAAGGPRGRSRPRSEEHMVLLDAARLVDRSSTAKPDRGALLQRLDRLFDEVRDPLFRPGRFMELEIVRLELGVIRCQLLGVGQVENVWRIASRMVGGSHES